MNHEGWFFEVMIYKWRLISDAWSWRVCCEKENHGSTDPSLMIYYYTEWYSKWSQPPLVRCNWHIYPPIGNNHTPRNETNKRNVETTRQLVIVMRQFDVRLVRTEFPEPKVDLLIVRKAQNHFWSPGTLVDELTFPQGVGSTHDGEGVWLDLQGGWLVGEKLIQK